MSNDPELILDCIEAGAHAYVLQGASGTQIIEVIEQIDQGQFRCSAEVIAKLFERLAKRKVMSAPDDGDLMERPSLTQRELEVLHYIAQDYSDRAIADQLGITVRTVKHPVHNILQKLDVKYRRDAAQLAIQKKWVT